MGCAGVLQEDVAKAARQYADQVKQDPESKALLRAEQVLRHAIVPGHNKFFDRVSRLPGGLKFLIDMRHDLLVNWSFAIGHDRLHQCRFSDGQEGVDGLICGMLYSHLTVIDHLG